jgi:hypothetical protein
MNEYSFIVIIASKRALSRGKAGKMRPGILTPGLEPGSITIDDISGNDILALRARGSTHEFN